MTDVCSTAIECLYDFQPLLAGLLALAAAIAGGAFVVRSARLPVEAQKSAVARVENRKAIMISQVLSKEFARVSEMARQAASTMKVVIAARKEITDTIRAKVVIDLHALTQDIESMSLLPEDLIREALDLTRALDRHNFDMRRAGGSFGDDNFQRHVQDQALALAKTAHAAASSFDAYSQRLARGALTD